MNKFIKELLAWFNRRKKRNDEEKSYEKLYHSNYRFLAKWSQEKYSGRSYLSYFRSRAYRKQFGLNNTPVIQYGVQILCEHFKKGKLKIGKGVLLARECDLDFTGDLIIEDGVAISEGVKILTHNHEIGLGESDRKCVLTPLSIREGVWIGARAIIMPGVIEIGRGAMIGAGALITKKIPPYAVVMGNPAKIVGFRGTPEEINELEKKKYLEEERIPLELLEKNYDKYFLQRLNEIKQFTKL